MRSGTNWICSFPALTNFATLFLFLLHVATGCAPSSLHLLPLDDGPILAASALAAVQGGQLTVTRHVIYASTLGAPQRRRRAQHYKIKKKLLLNPPPGPDVVYLLANQSYVRNPYYIFPYFPKVLAQPAGWLLSTPHGKLSHHPLFRAWGFPPCLSRSSVPLSCCCV